jgi:hypothetical protein
MRKFGCSLFTEEALWFGMRYCPNVCGQPSHRVFADAETKQLMCVETRPELEERKAERCALYREGLCVLTVEQHGKDIYEQFNVACLTLRQRPAVQDILRQNTEAKLKAKAEAAEASAVESVAPTKAAR